MAILGTILSLAGALGMLVFTVMILIHAFKKSVGWGLASLLIPFAILVYVFQNWAEVKTPFLRSLICLVVVGIGTALSIMGAISSAGVPQVQ